MNHIPIIRRIHMYLLGILLLIINIGVFLPNSPGYAYNPHHIANLFLPNFGLDFEYSTFPYYARSVLTQYVLNKAILILVANEDPLILDRTIFLVSTLFRIPAYIILLTLLQFEDKKLNKSMIIGLSILFTITISWSGIPLMLISTILWSLIRTSSPLKILILGILSYLALSLYWHSAGMIGFSLIVAYIIVHLTFSNKKHTIQKWGIYTYILITVISWIFIRGLTYGGAFRDVIILARNVSINYILRGVFSKGNFVPRDYIFSSKFFIPSEIINFGLYISYAIITLISVLILYHNLWQIDKASTEKTTSLLMVILLGNILFMGAYFSATFIFPPVVFQTLLYPFVVTYILSGLHPLKNTLKIKLISLFLVGTLVASFGLGTLQIMYTSTFEDTRGETSFDMYFPSIEWISHHIQDISIISDGNTGGYYQIILSKYHLYETSRVKIFKWGITLRIYENLVQGKYRNEKSLLVVNTLLFKKHLRLVSLQAWNRFKPLPSGSYIVQNNLLMIYNDNNIVILY
ncbi:hypothetical protein GQS_05965 [Thermococcus sp. 4557]|uniref:hypothetical protein n=1 Tax=Thermococcus sp. (strain CGMCC 1.5172 / 4557) TaxID=1042877 RepID=UPI000219EEE2|nr:hypothetical protein [Thermococcus sp. 4557]AEK73091.1 hypothetical protein GQS_05965 [Thermococcus sp. 4557]